MARTLLSCSGPYRHWWRHHRRLPRIKFFFIKALPLRYGSPATFSRNFSHYWNLTRKIFSKASKGVKNAWEYTHILHWSCSCSRSRQKGKAIRMRSRVCVTAQKPLQVDLEYVKQCCTRIYEQKEYFAFCPVYLTRNIEYTRFANAQINPSLCTWKNGHIFEDHKAQRKDHCISSRVLPFVSGTQRMTNTRVKALTTM